MITRFRTFDFLMALFLASPLAHATLAPVGLQLTAPDLRAASYDGKWTGLVKCLYDPGLWPEDYCDVNFTFNIHGSSISVEQTIFSKNGKETKSAVKPGGFKFYRLATNAIAFSMDSGKDEDGTWVETWSFVMTLLDANHMIVHWTRVVNNIDMPIREKGSKFSSVGMGELVRDSTQK